ncbi:hypothetical protein OG889_25155 [Streptomyces sp. NBC_00481]|uniref:hypothetical protein n=1 Tax=Streptomyces sp. NBC_00481 TaxID=2975755 RepID=UPI002DD9E473|nr:hypothetical protein [Streptomyces sp. NBC_00481]WRY97706.1 hypothetical protein OG889_25155 [Streptomyces sp. NBC_00481]
MRRSGINGAVAAVIAAFLVAACGENTGKGSASSEGRDSSANSTSREPWTEADLDLVALGERDGEKPGRIPMSTGPSERRAEPDRCSAIARTIGRSSSAYAAHARINRTYGGKGTRPGAVMTLASHRTGDAKRVVRDFRTAADNCTAFKEGRLAYEDVEVQPDPGYGDESVSVRLVEVVSNPDGVKIRVPHAVVVLRQGTTVAMFHHFVRPNPSDGKKPARIPDELVKRQVEKIRNFGAVK